MYHILTILKPKGFLLTHPCHHPHFFNTANYRHEPEHVQGEARLAHFIAPTIWGIYGPNDSLSELHWSRATRARFLPECARPEWLHSIQTHQRLNHRAEKWITFTSLPHVQTSDPPLVRQRNGACCKRDGSTGSRRGRKQRGRCLHLRRMLCSKWRGWRRGGGECSSLLLRQRTSQDRTGPFFASNSRGDFLALKIPVTLKPPSKVRKWIICSDQIILSLRHFFNFHNCVVPKGEWHSGISVYFWHKSRSIFH